jgi:hypothetical protein
MLSHEDQQRLAVIEQQLVVEDPVLAERFAHHHHRCARQLSRKAVALVLGSLCLPAAVVERLPADVQLALLVALPVLTATRFVRGRARRRPG